MGRVASWRLLLGATTVSVTVASLMWFLRRRRGRASKRKLLKQLSQGAGQDERLQAGIARLRAEADRSSLVILVEQISDGKLVLVDTVDRGRCLVTAQSLKPGTRICDEAIVPHGTDEGLRVARASPTGLRGAERFSSADFLAALDFMASLAEVLAQETDLQLDNATSNEETGVVGSSKLLWALYRFSQTDSMGFAERVPMIRRWHAQWHLNNRKLPVETMEAAWQHVVPNWRRLVVATPRGGLVLAKDGQLQPVLGHTTVCGLWLLMAMCEHSCDPNCALLHDGENLWILVLRPIPAGEAVTTSYLSLESLRQPWHVRQKELSEAWGFDCRCTRCLEELSTHGSTADQASTLGKQGFAQCSMAPGESEEDRSEYCHQLGALCREAHEMHKSAESPAFLSLHLLKAIFAPPGPSQDMARSDYLQTSERVHGSGSRAARQAKMLGKSPKLYLEEVMCEVHAALVTAGEDAAGVASDIQTKYCCESDAPHDTIRQLYRRHLESRSWSRRRTATAVSYLASEAS
mmetsp:Transcript_112805/g.224401  ORF Transcript_112805/g.224401 Transcript_112805/m.224401 type:complete len:521 (+) Transcript_112805:61-1623(+)|eukprot:CAMPEP_0172666746 /NCGR_PEP_ID=MMETSP1074-20121228/7996_1 /TAXON_ID=2916 /ORGANISM="Ceratium fusus, Strain PA161109" /LENGTH=520 /DNA_ID=CAMNT_0013483167 /DNA_START=61 /DNA_END=1623 /DNA_ORIENTATION=-